MYYVLIVSYVIDKLLAVLHLFIYTKNMSNTIYILMA